MFLRLLILLLIVWRIGPVRSAYSCLCYFSTELSVLESPSATAPVLGAMKLYDCKPIFSVPGLDPSYVAIHFEGQVGYIENEASAQIEMCSGFPMHADLTMTTSSNSATSVPTTMPSIISTPSSTTTRTSTNSPTTTTSTPVTTTTSAKTNLPSTTPSSPTIVTTTIQTPTTEIPSTNRVDSPNPTISNHCPNGWIAYGQSCYLFKTGENDVRMWVYAKGIDKNTKINMYLEIRMWWTEYTRQMVKHDQFCREHNSHLVFIETREEQHFIYNHVQLPASVHGDTFSWIGASDEQTEGHWLWRDNYTKVNRISGYTNWGSGQGTDGGSNDDQDCGTIYRHNGVWYDQPCSGKHGFTCETSMHTHPTTVEPHHSTTQLHRPITVQQHQHTCPHHWVYFEKSCYEFVTDHSVHLSWSQANEYCAHSNAHLVFIETDHEQRFLQNELSHLIHLHGDEAARFAAIWIGASDQSHEGHWVWNDAVTGHQIQIHGPVHWVHGKPDDFHGQDCAALMGVEHFKWDDFDCRLQIKFICEKAAQ